MNQKVSLKTSLVVTGLIVLVSALCAVFSYYAMNQGKLNFLKLSNDVPGHSGSFSGWQMLRKGPILGYALPFATGSNAYMLMLDNTGGEYVLLVKTDNDGRIKESKTVYIKGSAFIWRLAYLLEKEGQEKPSKDTSVLDPFVLSTFNNIMLKLGEMETEMESKKN